jgi:hypothetical protein
VVKENQVICSNDKSYENYFVDQDFSDNESQISANVMIMHQSALPVIAQILEVENKNHRLILDTGCINGHVVINKELLTNSAQSGDVTIQGLYSSDALKSVTSGNLPSLNGRAYFLPEATTNLISMRELIKDVVTFGGNNDQIIVKDKHGSTIITAKDKEDGFWYCSYDDLIKPIKANTMTYLKTHFSAEERLRAKEAFDL